VLKFFSVVLPEPSLYLQMNEAIKLTKVLGIDSLELCSLCYDLVFVHIMLFGLVYMNFNDYFTLRAHSTTCGHEYKLF